MGICEDIDTEKKWGPCLRNKGDALVLFEYA